VTSRHKGDEPRQPWWPRHIALLLLLTSLDLAFAGFGVADVLGRLGLL
jgi:hypothetical protein